MTLTNAGTISGSILFDDTTSDNRLVLAPGSQITGSIFVGGTGNVLELEAGAGSGTFNDFAGNASGFGSVVLDSGADWVLSGASPSGVTQTVTFEGNADVLGLATPGTFADGISGLVDTDELDLRGLTYNSDATAVFNGGILSVTSDGVTDQFTLLGTAIDTPFNISQDSVGGTLVEVACYCPGTLILTSRGEMPVQDLLIGDTVVTASGQHRPIKWIGNRSYAGRFLASNPRVQPIRLHAGSLGDGLPRRDLLVSPEHAMFLDGLLVPARCLVNDCTIVQESGLERVDYYHIELDTHDVLLAEGCALREF